MQVYVHYSEQEHNILVVNMKYMQTLRVKGILHYNVYIYNIPLVSPKARRTKADSFKFLSSARLAARTLRVKLQKMRPPLKDELIS